MTSRTTAAAAIPSSSSLSGGGGGGGGLQENSKPRNTLFGRSDGRTVVRATQPAKKLKIKLRTPET